MKKLLLAVALAGLLATPAAAQFNNSTAPGQTLPYTLYTAASNSHVVPAGAYSEQWTYCGAGGPGAGGFANVLDGGGGGGGAGGCYTLIVPTTPGITLTVTVGQGVSGGAIGAAGATNGGATFITGFDGSLILPYAWGGCGGATGTATNGGLGGSGATGNAGAAAAACNPGTGSSSPLVAPAGGAGGSASVGGNAGTLATGSAMFGWQPGGAGGGGGAAAGFAGGNGRNYNGTSSAGGSGGGTGGGGGGGGGCLFGNGGAGGANTAVGTPAAGYCGGGGGGGSNNTGGASGGGFAAVIPL